MFAVQKPLAAALKEIRKNKFFPPNQFTLFFLNIYFFTFQIQLGGAHWGLKHIFSFSSLDVFAAQAC